MLTGIVWHGTGFLCVCALIILIAGVWRELQGKSRRQILCTVSMGLFSGIAGVALAVCVLMGIDNATGLRTLTDVPFSLRLIALSFFFTAGAGGVGVVTEKLLPKLCCTGPTRGISFIVSTLLVLQPIGYAWLVVAWSFFYQVW